VEPAVALAAAALAALAIAAAPQPSPSAAAPQRGSTLPLAPFTPRPHLVGDALDYSLRGTLSQAIAGHDQFGRAIAQPAVPTDLEGRERVAVKAVDAQGLSLHRSGTIVATFKGRSSPSQTGAGWTLVTPQGEVRDRKGSTLGGLFLLPLAFMADRAVNGGALPVVGERWTAKLGMALFGMTAQPRLRFHVIGTRQIFGVVVYTLSATGTAPVREPVVTNDGVALGDAVGTSRVLLHCDYDPAQRRAVSMDILVAADLRIGAHEKARGSVTERQHYLVALDTASFEARRKSVDPRAPKATSSPTP